VVQNWETASKGQIQRKLIQLGATLILTLCIWGHVSEIFDYWDNTFQAGNDIEYSTVIVALIAGAGFGIAYSRLTHSHNFSKQRSDACGHSHPERTPKSYAYCSHHPSCSKSLRDPCSCSRLRSSRKVCITDMIAPSGRSSSVHPHIYACMGTVCAPCQMPGAKAGRQSTHARSDGWSTADSSFERGRSRFMTCSSDVILARHNIATALRRCVGHQGTQIGELSKASNASDSFSSMKPG